MNYIKHTIFLFLLMVSISCFSQSRLINAGKTGKVAETSIPSKQIKQEGKKTTNINKNLKQSGEKYRVSGYMEITGMSFANTDKSLNIFDDFGSDIYAKDLKYLRPVIFYSGKATSDKEIQLDIKIIKEDGTLEKGKNSPNDYTFSDSVKVVPGDGKSLHLKGWGNNSATGFAAGYYRYEIWHEGNLLYHKGFRIYPGKNPVVKNNLLSISDIKFGNGDYNRNLLSDYGEPLVENEVQYLQPKMSYIGNLNQEQNVTLMIRIVLPDGNMSKGSNSPLCFSTSSNITIKPGYNDVILMGWGNKNATLYKKGKHKYEIWLNGDKIYETFFEVKDKSVLSTNTSIDQFFPIWGITLGKTTWEDAEKAGWEVKIWDKGPKRVMDVYNADFWDHGAVGKFTSVYWNHSDGDFPSLWKSKGFDWKNSFDKWLEIFKDLGYSINIKNGPTTKKYSGRNTLSADVVALSPDGILEFHLDFDYGNGGHYTYSPNSLYSLNVKYKEKTTSKVENKPILSSVSSLDQFFPIWGITLGTTTWEDAQKAGYKVEKWQKGPDRVMEISNVDFWDHDGKGKFTSLYWSCGDGDFPTLWKSKGFDWKNSYNKWIEIFKNLGYNVKIEKGPTTSEFLGRKTLSADVVASSSDGLLEFRLDFDYGDGGHYTYSPNSLYSIKVTFKGIIFGLR